MDRAKDLPINEIERLRRLVPDRPDWHLHNWGIWRRGYYLVDGYDDHSTCLENMGGCSSEDASDHVFERELPGWAMVTDSAIRELPASQKIVLGHVYEAAVFKFRGDLDAMLVEAAAAFWRIAYRKGLV